MTLQAVTNLVPLSVSNLMYQLKFLMPLKIGEYSIGRNENVVFIPVDEINAFCKPGCGPLAPVAPSPAIRRMILNTHNLARRCVFRGKPIILFKDCHEGIEHPWPPHARRGSEEAQMVKELAWLDSIAALIIEKDCVSGWIGAEYPPPAGVCDRCGISYSATTFNLLREFLIANNITRIVVAGICTDICVMQLVHNLLSARTKELIPYCEVIVYTEATATFDLPLEVCLQLGRPAETAHPAEPNQYWGLYNMQLLGAILADRIILL